MIFLGKFWFWCFKKTRQSDGRLFLLYNDSIQAIDPGDDHDNNAGDRNFLRMRYDHVAGKIFITCHFTKMMSNYTALIGKNIIDNIKRHDCNYEMDDFGVVIGESILHDYAAHKVVRIHNCFVECRKVEGPGEQTITLTFAELKQQLVNYYANND